MQAERSNARLTLSVIAVVAMMQHAVLVSASRQVPQERRHEDPGAGETDVAVGWTGKNGRQLECR